MLPVAWVGVNNFHWADVGLKPLPDRSGCQLVAVWGLLDRSRNNSK